VPIRRSLVSSLLLLAAAIATAGACARRPAPAGPPDVELRVMTYNIRYGNDDLDRIATAIEMLAPHVVALQEVDVRWEARSRFVDQAEALGERLGMHVRFAPIYSLPGARASSPRREFGVALLSRFEVVRFRNDSITRRSTQEPNAAPAPAPGLLDATLDVRGVPVRVLNVHLDFRAEPAVRARQVAELLARLDTAPAAGAPTILFGDMNAPPDAAELRPLRERLRDAWPDSAGPGATYPADAPARRIDQVYLSPHFRVRAAAVPETRASDHRPVVLDLSLMRR
jgi:endonuclease/exonuclease/phosphatase family metal-dependent hydrolase